MPKAKHRINRNEPHPVAPETPAPEPQAPKPEPLRKSHYGESILGKVAILRINASLLKTDDEALLDEIVTNVTGGDRLSFREACWNAITGEMGPYITWSSLKRHSEDIGTLVKEMEDRSWFGTSFLSLACHVMRSQKRRLLPEDVLEMVDDAHADYMDRVDAARDLLRENPGVLVDDIRAVLKSHPDLTELAE
jgi:hypothetical protein